MKPPDLTGQVFGKLTVVAFAGTDDQRCKLWRCVCECGGEKTTRGSSLSAGDARSCGCLNIGGYRHGHGSPGKQTKTYKAWANMKDRCENPANQSWADYGGRGITVDPAWSDFVVFLNDMGEAPEGKSLDRKNNDGPYCKDNCRWATPKEQQRNRRVTKMFTIAGETRAFSEWCEILGINRKTAQTRMRRGSTFEQAVAK